MTNPLVQATALYHAGRYAEAEAEARSVAAAPRTKPEDEVFGPLALGIAGLAVSAQGRHAEAVSIFDALLPVFDGLVGAEHPLTLKLRSDRAHALSALGRYAECEAECAAVAQLAARNTGPEVPLIVVHARTGQIQALIALGRHEEAEALSRQNLAAHCEPDQATLILRLGLARSLNCQGRHVEALAEAERADEVRRDWPEEHRRPETGAVELAAAIALLGLGRGTEARLLAAAARDDCLAAFGPDNSRTIEAQVLLDRIDGA
ncbi:tetratricopeptide repeat protein [Kitasatospora sp. NPDC057542]|uniref:tetratricopeptide repeat protein n=1 Tax=Kitasatospora sp. NPDC057542 TaxID=3346162 RepID=UPI0036BCBA97